MFFVWAAPVIFIHSRQQKDDQDSDIILSLDGGENFGIGAIFPARYWPHPAAPPVVA
jgi:hypothetical protein